jgi:hypothetical protein
MRRRYLVALQAAVSSESYAYGFTLLIWTTAALVGDTNRRPRVADAFAYLGGALTAMSVVAVCAFAVTHSAETHPEPMRRAYGAIHVLSVAAGIGCGWGLSLIFAGTLAYALAAFAGVLTYQVILAAEVAVAVVPRAVSRDETR